MEGEASTVFWTALLGLIAAGISVVSAALSAWVSRKTGGETGGTLSVSVSAVAVSVRDRLRNFKTFLDGRAAKFDDYFTTEGPTICADDACSERTRASTEEAIGDLDRICAQLDGKGK